MSHPQVMLGRNWRFLEEHFAEVYTDDPGRRPWNGWLRRGHNAPPDHKFRGLSLGAEASRRSIRWVGILLLANPDYSLHGAAGDQSSLKSEGRPSRSDHRFGSNLHI
ncbi:hypothetical protein [Bradyrhizobium sp. RDM4]|uniref:hypothetical protein n=1 Tax=Bradyrhizobium sp. RDM4 TaxID=3378765 RepID=UPI0038FC8CC8